MAPIRFFAMKHVLTLIGNSTTPLNDKHVESARALLYRTEEPRWLAAGVACDIEFDMAQQHLRPQISNLVPSSATKSQHSALHTPASSSRLEEELRVYFVRIARSSIDLVVQPVEGRQKRLLVADMDSTIIGQECIDELAAELGIKPQIAAITERAMRGEIDFEPALRERVGLLKGLPLEALEKVYRERITETPGARALTATMRAHGHACALVSGGFTFFTERVAHAVGFNVNQANRLIFVDGKLTGGIAEPILGREAKTEALVRLRDELGLHREETLAVGDGANDLGMIGEAGLGVAYHAKPVVAEAADARIDHGDLTALLYMQGYRHDEIATGH